MIQTSDTKSEHNALGSMSTTQSIKNHKQTHDSNTWGWFLLRVDYISIAIKFIVIESRDHLSKESRLSSSLKESDFLFNCGGAEDALDDVWESETTDNDLFHGGFLVCLDVGCGESLSWSNACVHIGLGQLVGLNSPGIDVLVLPVSSREAEFAFHVSGLCAEIRPVALWEWL